MILDDKFQIREKISDAFSNAWRSFNEYMGFNEHKDDIADTLDGIDKLEFLSKADDLQRKYEKDVETIYRATTFFLESVNMNSALAEFKTDYKKTISNKDIHDTDQDESGEIVSKFLIGLREYLLPLGIWGDTKPNSKMSFGLEYLENILRQTGYILSKFKIVPKTETEVYNAVKIVVKSIFPSSQHPKSHFVDNVKEYKPDIVIPELAAAVEYKFADSEEKMKVQIEEIHADVKGYSGNIAIEHFYAVFYADKDYLGSERLKFYWRNKFPKNWKCIQIIGPISE